MIGLHKHLTVKLFVLRKLLEVQWEFIHTQYLCAVAQSGQ